MSSSLLLIILLFHDAIHNVLGNIPIDCRTIQSTNPSGTGDGNMATASCPASHPTLVSCGHATVQTDDDSFEGSYIYQNNVCIARNAISGSGVYAYARCCKFNQAVTCVVSNGIFAHDNDALSTQQCPSGSNRYMLGCSAYTTQQYFDGVWPGTSRPQSVVSTGTGSNVAYPETKHCNGQNGAHGNTRSNINCCTTSGLGLQCNIYYGAPSKISAIQCPSHQSMMACMATNNYMTTNAWYISSSNVCIGRSRSNEVSYASAICCNEVTASPTLSPTNNPTHAPTNNPTRAPTDNPSFVPTNIPTNIPTIEPTMQTETPTDDPTTAAPTNKPTAAVVTAFINQSKTVNNNSVIDTHHLAMLIGIIFGALCLCCLCIAGILLILWFVRKKKHDEHKAGEIQNVHPITPMTVSSVHSDIIMHEGQNTTPATETEFQTVNFPVSGADGANVANSKNNMIVVENDENAENLLPRENDSAESADEIDEDLDHMYDVNLSKREPKGAL